MIATCLLGKQISSTVKKNAFFIFATLEKFVAKILYHLDLSCIILFMFLVET